MGQFHSDPSLLRIIGDLKKRLQALENRRAATAPVYTTATRPTADKVTQGVIIFVSDAAGGSKFQGWDGSAWVSLG